LAAVDAKAVGREGSGVRPATAKPGQCILPTPAEGPPPVVAASVCPEDPLGGPLKVPEVTVTFGNPNIPAVRAELMRTPVENQRGLMYRRSMPWDRGMLFRLARRTVQEFWMRDTCIPLDMIFVDDDGTIVGILENVPPMNEEPRSVGCPSAFVLEVNAGWARKNGLKAGQNMAIPDAAR
jgi:uncharacterized membrane protein (UPF0127 family)